MWAAMKLPCGKNPECRIEHCLCMFEAATICTVILIFLSDAGLQSLNDAQRLDLIDLGAIEVLGTLVL